MIKRDRYTYEAFFEYRADEDYYLVTFPDLPANITEGDDLEDAVFMAADLLELSIVCDMKRGVKLPKPSYGNKKEGCLTIAVSVCPRPEEEVIDHRLTTAEAAKRLGVSSSRIRQMVASGELRAEKEGRDLFVSSISVVEAVKKPRKVGRPSTNGTPTNLSAINSETIKALH